jgi:glucosamine-6-phosphate deaminase
MNQEIFDSAEQAAQAMAAEAAEILRHAVSTRGQARLVAATGASQLRFLELLVAAPGIDWDKIELFHLDEYVGIAADHPASFQHFIRERLVIPAGIRRVHYIDGMADPHEACAAMGRQISKAPIDLLFAGVGENGHLAFNEPPADFATEEPFLIVALDQRTRLQQVKEGWFARAEQVPSRAITMSVRQILKAQRILCIATGERKRAALAICFTGLIRREAPASALRGHSNATLFLDRAAAAGLQ